MTLTQRLIRGSLLFGVLVLCTILIAAHGLRGIAIVVAVAVLASAVRTQAFRATEQALVRLTGSRQRAAMLVMGLVIVVIVAVSVIEAIR
jgi:hypothetical protein